MKNIDQIIEDFENSQVMLTKHFETLPKDHPVFSILAKMYDDTASEMGKLHLKLVESCLVQKRIAGCITRDSLQMLGKLHESKYTAFLAQIEKVGFFDIVVSRAKNKPKVIRLNENIEGGKVFREYLECLGVNAATQEKECRNFIRKSKKKSETKDKEAKSTRKLQVIKPKIDQTPQPEQVAKKTYKLPKEQTWAEAAATLRREIDEQNQKTSSTLPQELEKPIQEDSTFNERLRETLAQAPKPTSDRDMLILLGFIDFDGNPIVLKDEDYLHESHH
jgi:hypothetical protein